MQIVVYAGAILVLYLFVVMLLSIKSEERYHNQLPVAGLLGVTLCTEVLLLLIQARSVLLAPTVRRMPPHQQGNTGNDRRSLVFHLFCFPSKWPTDSPCGHDQAIILAKKDIIESTK